MAAPVKYLYLTPVKIEQNRDNNSLRIENNKENPPVILMKASIIQQSNNFKLALPTGRGVYYFSPKQILRLEAKNNCTKFFFTNNCSLLICKTLKEYETLLSSHGFVRTHKSHLINKNFITQYHNTGIAVMQDNSCVCISRRKRKIILDLLKV